MLVRKMTVLEPAFLAQMLVQRGTMMMEVEKTASLKEPNVLMASAMMGVDKSVSLPPNLAPRDIKMTVVERDASN